MIGYVVVYATDTTPTRLTDVYYRAITVPTATPRGIAWGLGGRVIGGQLAAEPSLRRHYGRGSHC